MNKKVAVIYRRVSTTEQKDKGHSLPAQKEVIENYCLKNRIEVLEDFEEDFSAKNFIRPEMQKLIEFVTRNKGKIDFVLVHKWDRFSRSLSDALDYIALFDSLGVQVNACEQWIDFDEPQQHLMLHIYLSMGEVENRIKSDRTKMGIYSALSSGRYINMQPIGYVKGTDESGKPLMQPDSLKSPLIKDLLEKFASGNYTQNELLEEYGKTLCLKRATLSRMLRNPLYAGLVRVPEYKGKPEHVVRGLHEPLISDETYSRIQLVLQGRSSELKKPKSITEEFPLRGFLSCPDCGAKLTGSGSRSKTGRRYFYYHSNAKCRCNIRFRASDANDKFHELLANISPNSPSIELFKEILTQKLDQNRSSNKKRIRELETHLNELENMEQSLIDKYVIGSFDEATFDQTKKRYEKKSIELTEEMARLQSEPNITSRRIENCVRLISNLEELYSKANVKIKQALQSSIFSEPLVFDGVKYRTPVLKEAVKLILNTTKELEDMTKKKRKKS